jgi:hypothetical protein
VVRWVSVLEQQPTALALLNCRSELFQDIQRLYHARIVKARCSRIPRTTFSSTWNPWHSRIHKRYEARLFPKQHA